MPLYELKTLKKDFYLGHILFIIKVHVMKLHTCSRLHGLQYDHGP